jgi:hypothetical protein
MKLYGCHNHKPYKPNIVLAGDYKIQDGQLVREEIKIPFRGLMSCNYQLTELGRDDPKCEGCSHRDH